MKFIKGVAGTHSFLTLPHVFAWKLAWLATISMHPYLCCLAFDFVLSWTLLCDHISSAACPSGCQADVKTFHTCRILKLLWACIPSVNYPDSEIVFYPNQSRRFRYPVLTFCNLVCICVLQDGTGGFFIKDMVSNSVGFKGTCISAKLLIFFISLLTSLPT